VRSDKAFLASLVAKRGLVEQAFLLGPAEGFGRASFTHEVIQRGGVAIDKGRASRVLMLTVTCGHRTRFYDAPGSGLPARSRRECSTFYIGSAVGGLPYSEACADGRR